MIKLSLLIFTVALSLSAHADTPVDAALKQLEIDTAKLQRDLDQHADKETIDDDKHKLKADKATLRTARKNQKDWFATHQPSSD